MAGYVAADSQIWRAGRQDDLAVGRVDDAGRIFRTTLHDERELGEISTEGVIHSHGLFEGGTLGWLEADGVVMQGGMIFDEDEVGRVDGPNAGAAARRSAAHLPTRRRGSGSQNGPLNSE